MFTRFLNPMSRFLFNDDPSTGGGGGEPAPSDAPPANDPAPSDSPVKEWKDFVSQEYREKPMFANYKSMDDVFKSLEHAQTMVGRDKAVIPTKNSHADEFKQYFQKVGLPETREAYKPNLGELSEEQQGILSDLAYEKNMLPDQLEAVVQYFDEQNKAADAQYLEQYNADMKAVEDTLKKDFGDAYEQKMLKAMNVAKRLGGDEFSEYINNNAIGSDEKFLRFLVDLSDKVMSEDTFSQETVSRFSMTPSEAQMELNKIRGDMSSPYYNKNHAQHADFVKKALELQEIVSQTN